MANTPLRALRIAPEVWEPAQERAAENGETVSDVVRRALNVAASSRMCASRPNSVEAFLLALHTFKMERGE